MGSDQDAPAGSEVEAIDLEYVIDDTGDRDAGA